MAIEIGDAVLKFIGDSQQLDTKFAEVQPNAQQAFDGAAEAVEEGTARMKFSMKEARGEARLLGEEFGIRLPRHVSNFVAELPGVGEAMSAAFSATAILFIAQALVQASDKLSNFVGNTLIFTDGMRQANAEVEAENKTLLALADIYGKAKERLDELNGVQKTWEDQQRAAIQTQVDLAKAQLAQMEATIANKSGWQQAKDTMKDVAGTILGQVIPGYFRLATSTQEQIALEEKRGAIAVVTANALKANNEVDKEEAAKKAKLALDNSVREIENQKKVALAYAQTDQEKFELSQAFEEKKLALLNSYAVKDKAAIQALLTEIEVQQIQHAQKIEASFVNMLQMVQQQKVAALDAVKDSVVADTIALSPLAAALAKAQDAAHSMGITLRTDLVAQLERSKAAMQAFLQSGIVDKEAFKQFQDAIKKADTDLKNFGHTVDTFKVKSHGLWGEFRKDTKDGETQMDALKQLGVNAFDDLSRNIESAFQAIVMGQGNVAQALEKATAESLAQIASQAAVKSLFYAAEGTAALFTDPGAAGGYFVASAEMAAIAALAGIAGHELAGAAGGGGSNNHEQGHNSVSNTGSTNRSGGTSSGVQAFAEGGLILQPTLALAGEAGREAVIPLDDPQAQKQMREAGLGGGGGNVHFHLPQSMIVTDHTLQKLAGQLSKAVQNGRVHLTASNSLRLTKRSA